MWKPLFVLKVMAKTYNWYYVYRNVCGKVNPQPTNLNLFDHNFHITDSLTQDELKDADTLSLIDTSSIQSNPLDYPALGTFVYIGVFLGVRLETMLLDQTYNTKSFRQVVGLKNGNEARIIDAQATSLRIYNFKDAARLGYFQGLSFDIVPADARRTAIPYGARYHTGTSFDTSLNHDALRNDLINFQFKFGTNNDVKYIIDRDTIKVRRSRKESPDF